MQSRTTPVSPSRARVDEAADRIPSTPTVVDARASRGSRVLRAVAAASVATIVALLAHLAGGGAMPGAVGVVVPWILAVAVCTLLVGRSLSVWRLTLAVVASQSLFHGLFVLGMPAGSAAPGTAMLGHHVPAPTYAVPQSDPASAAMPALLQSDPMMWLGHALAAAATVAALYRGEYAVRRLLALAVEIVHAVRRRAAALAVGIVRVPRRTVPVTADAPALLPLGWHPCSLARRGPPILLSV